MLDTIPPKRPSRRLLPGALMLMAVVLLLGYALRVYHLDVKDIWVDEAHPWWFARLPVLESVRLGFTGGPINSGADPLYNILLHYWIKLTGDGLFALRYLSVLTNLLGVAYLGRVTARTFGWKVGQVALLVGATASVWVFYSQEIRPYAFTPALMLVMIEAVIQIAQGRGRRAWPWAWLVVGEALALYAHGFMLFGIFGINLWLGWLWLRRIQQTGRWLWLRNWVASQIAMLLLIVPSIPTYLARSGGIRNPFVTPLTVPQFANELWVYFMGIPWENVNDIIPLRFLVIVILLGVWVGLLINLRRSDTRNLADLVWLVVGIAVLTLIYSWRDPSVHPRYMLFLSAPLFMILAALIARGWEQGRWGQGISVLLMLTLLVTTVFSVEGLYTERYSGYRHPSTRAVTDYLKTHFGAQDGIVVVAPHDYTLAYYGTGEAPLAWARFDEGIDTPAEVLDFIRGKQAIAVVRNTNERSDSRRILPFCLERLGSLINRQFFTGYDISTYRLDPDVQPTLATFQPAHFNWGVMTLVGQSIESGDAVTVALQWQAGPSFVPSPRYAASIRLVDPLTGWTVGGADALLLSDNGSPTSEWQPRQQTTQYFVLPLQPGTPPIEANVILTLYDSASGQALDLRDENGAPAGQEATLSRVTLGPAPQTWAYNEDQRPWRLTPVSSKLLSGYTVDKPVTSPGGMLGVTLSWLATPDEVEDRRVRLQLVQGGTVLAEDNGPILQGRHPAEVQTGQPWLDHRLLQVSREARPGPVDLVMWVSEQKIVLGTLEVAGFERITQRPEIEHPLEATFGDSIRLLGYRLDVPDSLISDDVVTLTLYWQALADGRPDANYKVFTQILGADGQLVGQHDGVPVYESRPFSGWLAGEYIVDEHPMKFIGAYSGPVRIQIGLYDPATMLRVLTSDGLDAVALPVELEVESGD